MIGNENKRKKTKKSPTLAIFFYNHYTRLAFEASSIIDC